MNCLGDRQKLPVDRGVSTGSLATWTTQWMGLSGEARDRRSATRIFRSESGTRLVLRQRGPQMRHCAAMVRLVRHLKKAPSSVPHALRLSSGFTNDLIVAPPLNQEPVVRRCPTAQMAHNSRPDTPPRHVIEPVGDFGFLLAGLLRPWSARGSGPPRRALDGQKNILSLRRPL
jgi:hypothetical protein